MEKRKPTYDLEAVKAALGDVSTMRSTRTAMRDVQALGLDRSQMAGVLAVLARADFHKSMTSHADHRVWQDVYQPELEGISLYVKFTVDDGGFLLLSFKEA